MDCPEGGAISIPVGVIRYMCCIKAFVAFFITNITTIATKSALIETFRTKESLIIPSPIREFTKINEEIAVIKLIAISQNVCDLIELCAFFSENLYSFIVYCFNVYFNPKGVSIAIQKHYHDDQYSSTRMVFL